MVLITDVFRGSRAYRAGIRANDTLVNINGNEINDVLDYRFYLAEEKIILKLIRNGAEYECEIKKDIYDDIGLSFETPLMDKKHRCENGCVFCFIDQLPKGLRESLYFKDDDSRLSFIHGNYITMTNLSEHDIDRIIKMHISPVNVSVHTTNPELRVMMMRNKNAGSSLSYLRRLADGGCKLDCQIVLCKNINDGAELDRTLRDLSELYPSVESVAIVPCGLTAFRDGLYPIEPFTPRECGEVIRRVDVLNAEYGAKTGRNLFFCSDEFYIKAGIPLPDAEYYGEYPQIENGVGMLRSLGEEADSFIKTLDENEKSVERTVSVATGEAAYDFISELIKKLCDVCPKLKVNVYKIKNNFFGGQVTVTGLLTGADLSEQLADKELGDELLLSRATLRSEGDLFLCGMTPGELSEKLNVKIKFTENDGADFLACILGI